MLSVLCNSSNAADLRRTMEMQQQKWGSPPSKKIKSLLTLEGSDSVSSASRAPSVLQLLSRVRTTLLSVTPLGVLPHPGHSAIAIYKLCGLQHARFA